MGIFYKGVKKTNRSFFERLSHAVIGRTEVDDDVLDAIEEALLATDMGVDTTMKIIENLEGRVRRDKYVSMGELVDMLREEIAELLNVDDAEEVIPFDFSKKPYVIMVVGVNGVGKTTTAINLAASLAVLEKKVLIIDADPQANKTSGLNFSPDNDQKRTLYEVMIGRIDISDTLIQTEIAGLHMIPSHINLVGAEIEMLEDEHRESVLKNALAAIKDDYDFIVIDCSPSLGFTTVNILTAADSVLVPVQCEYLALEGLSKLLNTIKMVKSRLNPELAIEGFVLTMYMRNRLNNQVVNEVREHFGELAYETIIQRNIRLGEAPSHGKPIMLYDASASGAVNYLNLAREFLKRNKTKRE